MTGRQVRPLLPLRREGLHFVKRSLRTLFQILKVFNALLRLMEDRKWNVRKKNALMIIFVTYPDTG